MFYKIAFLVAALAISFILFSSNIQKTCAYRSSSYYVRYGYYSGYSTASLAWYIWVIVSGGIFGTIVGVIVCCFCCRKRRLNNRGAVIRYNDGVTTVTGSTTVTPGYPGPQPLITGTQPYQPGIQQPYPTQPYQPGTQQPYPTQPTYEAPPYTQQQLYPAGQPYTGQQPPYSTDKMPEPPPYVAPDNTGNASAPTYTSNGYTGTGGGYDNQGASVYDNAN